jgi:hypothetical protein
VLKHREWFASLLRDVVQDDQPTVSVCAFAGREAISSSAEKIASTTVPRMAAAAGFVDSSLGSTRGTFRRIVRVLKERLLVMESLLACTNYMALTFAGIALRNFSEGHHRSSTFLKVVSARRSAAGMAGTRDTLALRKLLRWILTLEKEERFLALIALAPRHHEPGMARTGNYLVLPAGITSHYVLAIVRYRVRA